jgi:hypothetical protein
MIIFIGGGELGTAVDRSKTLSRLNSSSFSFFLIPFPGVGISFYLRIL